MRAIQTASNYGLNKQEMAVCKMAFDGFSDGAIADAVFGKSVGQNDYKRKRAKVKAILLRPNVQEKYREMMRQHALLDVGHGMKNLREQADNENAWIANKATNDLLNRAWPFVMGTEDKSLVVRVEGMPQLGTPDSEEE